MAGIYLHIPFCKKRCIYCDFFSTTRSEQKTAYIRALCRELTDREAYLEGEHIETIGCVLADQFSVNLIKNNSVDA